MAAKTIHVKVMSPKQTLFDGPAVALSSVNSQGKFDILPDHANFVTIVNKSPVIILTPDNKRVTFDLNIAIIYNTASTISVYTEIMT
jgi:F0F1-type ATP synthase epsilon subunit